MGKGVKRTFSVSENYGPASKKARAANKIKKFMKRTVGNKYRQATAGMPERKYCDVSLNTNPSPSGAAQLLLTVAQGSDNTDRIGRKITMSAIQYDVAWAAPVDNLADEAGWANNFAVAKMAVVYDKQPNGALATWSDVFNSTSNVITPYCFKNYNNIDRFDILAIEEYCICQAGPNAERKDRYIPCKLETRYDGTGATIADINSGALIVCYADNQTAAGTSNGVLQGRFRILYTDD